MDFKIRWLESHNPSNWGINMVGEKPDREKGIKNILDSYPYVKHWFADDGWLEGSCEATIVADDVVDAKEKACNEFECEVFDIFDEKGVLVGNEDGRL